MYMKKIIFVLLVLISSNISAQDKDVLVEITTDYGVMVARLYNSTPLHRDNFISKIKAGFYDSLLFHRVIQGFMIQGGDPTSKRADANTMLGAGSAEGDRVKAEIFPQIIHKKGALAAARDGNPEKASSNCQFYIVQGRKTDTAQLPQKGYSITQKEIYARLGGTPMLDQEYTVFGEVFIGLDVIDKIAAAPTNPNDRPIKDTRMKIRILN
jgi:cyclophilin family peptidyl-prolyl cis-trans isomerase